MATNDFNGLGVALVTPFHTDLSVNFKALECLIDHVISGGCQYIVALGTTAETPTLSQKEKEDVAACIRTHTAGRVPLVIGIGGNNTNAIVKDINTRNLEGYSAILSVTPYYNKPTQKGLFLHFKTIADNSPLPILLYNVPGRTGVNMTAKTTLELAHASTNICGIKEAAGDLNQCKEILKEKPERFSLISGNDSDTAAIMASKGAGVISVLANACPQVMRKLVDYASKDEQKAFKLQESLSPFIKHLFEDGNPAGVKCILSEMGMMHNTLRLPLVPVSDNVAHKLQEAYPSIQALAE